MSRDFVVLVKRQPDVRAVSVASGGLVRLQESADWPVQVFAAEGRLALIVEAPVLVESAGEVERLLGIKVEVPVWWVDVRSAADTPEAEPVAKNIASGLAAGLGGVVWGES